MDPVLLEFSDVCRYFLGKGGEYLAVGFSVIVLLGGIMVYWVLMSNFLFYTGTVVYAFSWRFPALTGTMTLSYFIHNAVITILRNQKNPENNVSVLK
ncbi:hypothetical protein ANCCEY_04549 [Ancylostoma ceylanicum]|uniref:Uncharacterized protein n=1 Tax=Ancylostoma ceylanicum TaxID=53326 RepID=A0A0D6LYW2_9BILA|nr:hypothetical protein ANCCEY_04549 [Ancylostoma ceylanicum]